MRLFESWLITVGLFAMFFGGWFGGYYSANCGQACGLLSENPHRIQWEVLLTGIAAISGGYMAFRGSTKQYIHQQKIAAAKFLEKLAFTKAFIISSDPNTRLGEVVINEYVAGEIALLKVTASEAMLELAYLPDVLSTVGLRRKVREAYAGLNAFSNLEKPRPALMQEVRNQAKALYDEVLSLASE